jgi:hypothetical protein
MLHLRLSLAATLLSIATASCGGSPAPDAQPPSTPKAPDATSAASGAPVASATPPAAATPSEPAYDDPAESAGPIALVVELDKKTPKSKFPKASSNDKKCWQEVALSGDHKKDFQQLIDKCGAPTGLLEYVKPVEGRLHHKHDKRDSYTIKLAGGFCYRYFAVGDGSTEDMDILVKKANGALVADDKTNSPAAIIHNDQPWCMDDDTELLLDVEVDGTGHGYYSLGVWVRPK